MSSSVSVAIFSEPLIRNIPELVAWGIGIVLAVLMVRRGGGKTEKLLLAGCSLMFVTQLASPLLYELVQWLTSERGMSHIATAQTMGWVTLPLTVISLAGLVCLVWAFWVQFRVKRGVSA